MNMREVMHSAATFALTLITSLCLLASFGTAEAHEPPKDITRGTARSTLRRWHSAGGEWRDADGGLRGSVDGTTRGFAIADDALFAGAQTLETVVTPLRRQGDSWSAGGLCLYENTNTYWRLALVESPDKVMRYAELTLQNEGAGIGEAGLRVVERTGASLDWKWNTPYRLRLTVAPDRILGEVASMDGIAQWRIVYGLSGAALMRAGWPAVGVQGMESHFSPIAQTAAIGAEADSVRCADLEEKPARSTWLSLPNSRLVVNPHISTAPPVPASVAPCLPMTVAYFTGETPVRLPYLWAWQFTSTDTAPPTVISGPSADFSPQSAGIWQAIRGAVVFTGADVRLSVGEVPFASLSTTVTVDLDRTPSLLVCVPKSEGQWALKVNAGQQAVDTALQADTTQTGNFVYDVPAATGWHGKRTFKIILFAVGAKGSTATISGLRFAGASGDLPTPIVKETAWYPHQFTANAETPNGAVKVESRIGMPDESSVAQRLRIRQMSGAALTLTGQLPAGSARWDPVHHAVIFRGAGLQAVIKISRAARWLGLYETGLDLLAGKPSRPDLAQGGAWAVALDGVQAGDEIVVTASFGQLDEPAETLLASAEKTADTDGFEQALNQQQKSWNARLNRLPNPLGFALHTLEPHGVTADAIRRTYYKAWVFLLSDSLPPQPENRFPYPQIACGKPSLWSEGAAGAAATSQWESFLAMQYLAYVDPLLAWQAYEGQMTLVSAEGMLGGEGLPSRHVQTAWVLYSLTGDTRRLRQVYPGMKRLLLWKAANPRWIYHNATPEDQKDSEFVVHALMDMDYAQRISHALSLPEEEHFWQGRSSQLAADYHRWFWDKSGHNYRLYRTSTGKSESPDQAWNLQGLALPPTILQPSERDSLLRLFRASVNRNIPFLIPALAGFPKVNFTLRGLWQYGKPEESVLLIESALRDTTLAGEFSESYTQTFPPQPIGVLPSVFGAAQIIDAVLWHNGVMAGDGLPVIVPVGRARGLVNMLLRGRTVDVLRDEDAHRLVLQGKGLSELSLPESLRTSTLVDGTPRWQGSLPISPGFNLTPKL